MKVRIVFTPVSHALDSEGLPCFPVGQHGLLFAHMVDNSGTNIESVFDGCWMADGDVEALELDVLPPLDKVTLTIQPTSDKPLPEPLYSAGVARPHELWPVKIRSVETIKDDGTRSITMGGPVAYTDTKEQAEELARLLNAVLRPDPNEPVP